MRRRRVDIGRPEGYPRASWTYSQLRWRQPRRGDAARSKVPLRSGRRDCRDALRDLRLKHLGQSSCGPRRWLLAHRARTRCLCEPARLPSVGVRAVFPSVPQGRQRATQRRSDAGGSGRVARQVTQPGPTDPDMHNSRIICWRQHMMRYVASTDMWRGQALHPNGDDGRCTRAHYRCRQGFKRQASREHAAPR